MNHNIAKQVLFDVADYLEKEGITFWLADGTLLGAVRNKDFLPNDTDIDLGFYQKDYDRVKMAVSGKIKIRKRRSTQFKLWRDGVTIDMAGYEKNGEWWNCYYHPHKKVVPAYFPVYLFDSLSKINFLSREFNAPFNPEEYLESRYFEWKIPRTTYNAKDYQCIHDWETFWATKI